MPGNHRLSLHAIYGDFGGQKVDRDQIEPKHFQSWIDWAKANNMKLDFNSTSFSHPKSGDQSLSNRDKGIRDFWIEHTIRSVRLQTRWVNNSEARLATTCGSTTVRKT